MEENKGPRCNEGPYWSSKQSPPEEKSAALNYKQVLVYWILMCDRIIWRYVHYAIDRNLLNKTVKSYILCVHNYK